MRPFHILVLFGDNVFKHIREIELVINFVLFCILFEHKKQKVMLLCTDVFKQ